jgi:hypothetical protein
LENIKTLQIARAILKNKTLGSVDIVGSRKFRKLGCLTWEDGSFDELISQRNEGFKEM